MKFVFLFLVVAFSFWLSVCVAIWFWFFALSGRKNQLKNISATELFLLPIVPFVICFKRIQDIFRDKI